MTEINLTQAEADALLAMEKRHETDSEYWFPGAGQTLSIPLKSFDGIEKFILDLRRSALILQKVTMQNRARQVVVLARLDLAGAPHRNPDGTEIPTPHLHVYREGFGDKWARPVTPENFPSIGDERGSLSEFMRYCNIAVPPF